MSFRYSVDWTSANGRWWHEYSFPDVATARTFALENAPPEATHYEIKRVGGDRVVKGELNK